MHNVKTYVELKFTKEYLNKYGCEFRSFTELTSPHIDRAAVAVEKVIEI